MFTAIRHAALLTLLLAATAIAARAALVAYFDQPVWALGFERIRLAVVGVLLLAAVLGLWVVLKHVQSWWRGRSVSTNLAPFRALLYVLVLWAAGFLILLQPFSRFYFDVTLGLAAACFLVVICFGPALARRLPARFVRSLDLVLGNLCLTLLLVEGGLRVMAQFSDSILFAQVDESVLDQVEQNRLQPGQMLFGFPCDDRGYYDEPPRRRGKDDRLVVAIGDSFGVGIVPHVYHYTTVAERRIPWCQIYNMGIKAVGPAAYRYMIEYDALPMKPDAVVVGVFVGNDVLETTRCQTDRGLRRWFDRDNLLMWLLPQRFARLRREEAELGRAGIVQGENSYFLEHSAEVMQLACPFHFDPQLEEPTFSSSIFSEIERSRAINSCGPDRGYYERFFADVLEMKRLCGKIPFLVLLIPDEFQVEDTVWERASQDVDIPLVRNQPQERIVPWLEQQGIPFLDLLPVFRAVEPEVDGNRHLYHKQDTHINARGNRILGEELARFLLRVRPVFDLEEFERMSTTLYLRQPGIPVPLPLCVLDSSGARHELATALPDVRFTSSDPTIVSVTDDGQVISLRRGTAEVTGHLSGRSAMVRIEADWPSILDLGGGYGPEPRPRLEVFGSATTLGTVLEVRMTEVRPKSKGNLAVMERPCIGGVRPRDPWLYDPGVITFLPVQADADGIAVASIPIPEDGALRGKPFFLAGVFGGFDTQEPREVTNVFVITPE